MKPMVWHSPLASLAPRRGWQQFGQQLETLGSELARRRALAFAPRPRGVHGPAWPRLLGELGTPIEHWQAANLIYTSRSATGAACGPQGRARSCCCPALARIRCG
jgi:hypothetical protein